MNRPTSNARPCRLVRSSRPERRVDDRARRSNRYSPRRSRTGSSSSPTTCRRTGRRRSAPRSLPGTTRIRHVPTGPRPLDPRELPCGLPPLARHVLPLVRRRRLARAPYAERTVAALEGSPEAVLCTTVQQYYRDGRAVPVTDPVPVLGGVDSPDAGTRVRALLHLLQHGGLGIDPVYSLARRDVAARTGLQGSIRDGDFVYSCEMALLGPFVHVPGGSGASHDSRQSRRSGSRGTSSNASSRSSASPEPSKSLHGAIARVACAPRSSGSRHESTPTASADAPARSEHRAARASAPADADVARPRHASVAVGATPAR